jgi:predicted GTPase
VLAANKIDSPLRVVQQTELEAFCQRIKIPLVHVSAKTGEGVDLAFETLAAQVIEHLQPSPFDNKKIVGARDTSSNSKLERRNCCQ